MGDVPTGAENPTEKHLVRDSKGIDPKTGLFEDAWNAFYFLEQISELYRRRYEYGIKIPNTLLEASTAKPLEDYDSFVRVRAASHGKSPEEIEAIITDSKGEKVRIFNKIVEIFNAYRERIRDQKDYGKIAEIAQLVEPLFGKKGHSLP